jgi:hypothetical protein
MKRNPYHIHSRPGAHTANVYSWGGGMEKEEDILRQIKRLKREADNSPVF